MLTEYEAHCRAAGHRPRTIRLRLYWLHRAESQGITLATATRGDLTNWLANHPGWEPETRKSARAALRSFYTWAVDAELLTVDPSVKLPAVKVPNGVPRPTPTEILRSALDGATDRDQLLIGCAAFAGMRRLEIATCEWTWIGWDGIRIVGKGGRTRFVPLLPQLASALRAEATLRNRGQYGTGWRFGLNPASPYVFPGRNGGHISPDTVGATLARLLGSGWSGHTLRHRFATLAYAVDRDLLTVRDLLGHSSTDTTARYTATPPGAAAAAVLGTAA